MWFFDTHGTPGGASIVERIFFEPKQPLWPCKPLLSIAVELVYSIRLCLSTLPKQSTSLFTTSGLWLLFTPFLVLLHAQKVTFTSLINRHAHLFFLSKKFILPADFYLINWKSVLFLTPFSGMIRTLTQLIFVFLATNISKEQQHQVSTIVDLITRGPL